MKILILTVGTRGDVQPYVAIGHGLQAKGHEVMLCAPAAFETFVGDYGLQFYPMPDDILKFLDSQAGRTAVEETRGIWGAFRSTVKLMGQVKPMQERIMQACWEAAQDFQPTGLIFHSKTLCGSHIAEKLGIPAMLTLPLPAMVSTGEFPLVGMPELPEFLPTALKQSYNRGSYQFMHLGLNAYRGLIQRFRTDTLGLPKQPQSVDFLHQSNGEPLPFLHPYSPHLLPRPTDWPPHIGVTGYAFLPPQEDWHPDEALEEFLAAGEPPLYIGFGSIGGKDPEATARIVLQAIQRAGVRAILATGWGGLQCPEALIPDTVHVIQSAPHEALFPRVAAVVHHGGAGSTAAGLRAGKPTLICPFFGDQPFWGHLVHEQGLGPEPLPQKQLTVTALTQRLQQLKHNTHFLLQAQKMAQAIQSEKGVGNAVDFIEKYLS